MMKLEMIQPEIIPGFDVLKWKQETQERIYRETEGMTGEEVRDYLRKGSERFEKKMARYRAEMKKGTC